MGRTRLFLSLIAAVGLATGSTTAYAADAPPSGPVDAQNVTWLAHADTPSAVAGLAFIAYPGRHDSDVMFADGVFGLRAWSLTDPRHPRLIGELPASALALPGDDVSKGFWEGEHLQVDPQRKLVFLTRDPRAFGGNKQTGTSGIDLVDAHDPAHLRLIGFHEEPGGHTSQCINGCRYLWSGGPSPTRTGDQPPGRQRQPPPGTHVNRPRPPATD